MSAVVSDSSPLNYLALLSDFDLLRQIYRSVVIPPAVYREVVESGAVVIRTPPDLRARQAS